MKRVQIMGILNVTEDSFFSGSRIANDSGLLIQAEKFIKEGAEILDIGGFSTRPGAIQISEIEELNRIENAVRLIRNEFPTISISVDTFRGKVAQVAIDHGASIINDISGFQFDESLLEVVSKSDIPYILMHVEGTFDTMHSINEKSDDIVERVKRYFNEKMNVLKQNGVSNVILDPGFGFSKTMNENHELLQRLDELQSFDLPLLVGVSRKSMIYKKLGIQPEDALNGTTALHTVAILKGASILRVHDVKACKEVIDLLKID